MREIRRMTFDVKTSKKEIENECNKIAERSSDYGGGLPGKIRWIDSKVFKDREEAVDYIDRTSGNYEQIAVKFLEFDGKIEPSSKMISLKARFDAELDKQEEYSKKHSVKTFKAAHIGCPNCGSKLNRELLKNEKCPLCNTDLRSKTTLEALAKYVANANAIQAQYKEEEIKNKERYLKKAKEKWLVKIEYHC